MRGKENDSDKENQREVLGNAGNLPRRPRGASMVQPSSSPSVNRVQPSLMSNGPTTVGAGPPPPSPFVLANDPVTVSRPVVRNLQPAPLQVHCMARTRIPTPHGPAFLHLYRNNKDAKEHLAIVIDPAQLEAREGVSEDGFIRSASLDAKWSDDETELDRLTRGAYVGRLTPQDRRASTSKPHASAPSPSLATSLPLPLVRIHSECFTGETIGSMRCDCGEQLDEAIRLISLPTLSGSPGRGAVIYLRQEGRGIGLLSKIRAYNLQDMGHDTVQANLLLGHGADERRYDIAGAIMKDLGLEEVELLTNNPDKVQSLEAEGVKVAKRRAMVPRSWRPSYAHAHAPEHEREHGGTDRSGGALGATMIGGGVTHGPELDRYLRTKVERMGHMLDLPLADAHFW